MSGFEGLSSASGLVLGPHPVPSAHRPRLHPEKFQDFRHSPKLRESFSGFSVDEIYAQWLERMKYVVEDAKQALESSGRSSTALARLAHAYLAAEDLELAADTAVEALDAITAGKDNTANIRKPVIDVSAAVAAGWALVVSGHADLAEARLAQLPLSLPIVLLRADIAVDAADFSGALRLLVDFNGPEVESMRGYILLKLNQPREAIRELRGAISNGSASADTRSTMAAAFWCLGSRRKAISYSRQASKLSPGRKDISLALIDYLINSLELDAASAEIRSILAQGVEDEPELIVRRARIAGIAGDSKKCMALLRRTESMAKASDDAELSCFARGQLALIEYKMRQIDYAEALRRVRRLLRECSDDASLAYVLSSLCDRKSMSGELRKVYETLEGRTEAEEMQPLAVSLAYLEGRYEDVAELVNKWSSDEPLNVNAANLAMLWTAYMSLDWTRAARIGESLIRRFPHDGLLANNVAYVSVLAGRPSLAERALRGAESMPGERPHVYHATRGLVEIAKGKIQSGLKYYRNSAMLAEREPDGQVERAKVITSQALALQITGIAGKLSEPARAGLLPSVSLPDNWREVPDLHMKEWLCTRLGLKWPPFID